MLDSCTNQSGGIADTQRLHQLGPMLLDCFFAQAQFYGDRLAGATFSDQLQHFPPP